MNDAPSSCSTGTAALIAVAAPAHAAPVSIGVQSLTDHEVAYANKGGVARWRERMEARLGSMVVAGATTRDGMEACRHGRQRGAIGVSTATATAGNACGIVPTRTRAGGLLCPVHKSRDLRTGRRFTKGACSDLRSRAPRGLRHSPESRYTWRWSDG